MSRASPLVLLAAFIALPAEAQTDQVALAHNAAANQLGVLEYCQSQGAVGPDAVAAERGSIATLPPYSGSTDAAEGIGKSGTISMNGTTMTLSSIASGRNTTVTAVCKQMGDAAIQTAAMFKQNGMGAAGRMPSMPGMPAMPIMGSMPVMPGMPAMPVPR